MLIQVIETKLSDGSYAYDVHLNGLIILHAVTYEDSVLLADKLASAVEQHTVDPCNIIFRWNS